jgi:hypothetical protein
VPFTAPSTGAKYVFAGQPMGGAAAQEFCAAHGADLATFFSLLEQADAEDYLVSQGVLLPAFHRAYWIGLHIPHLDPGLWPAFQWCAGLALLRAPPRCCCTVCCARRALTAPHPPPPLLQVRRQPCAVHPRAADQGVRPLGQLCGRVGRAGLGA